MILFSESSLEFAFYCNYIYFTAIILFIFILFNSLTTIGQFDTQISKMNEIA